MHGICTMFFATHINVATRAKDEQGQPGKYRKTYCNFPHIFPSKKDPAPSRPGVVSVNRI